MKQLQALHQRRPHSGDDPPENRPDEIPAVRQHGDVGFPGSPYGQGGHDDRTWNPPFDDPAATSECDEPAKPAHPDDTPRTGDVGGTG
jgi:hypothetical protein